MDGFLIGAISFFVGVIIDRAIIACCRRIARNNRNNGNKRNLSDNHNEETRENIENVVEETKQNNNKSEIEENNHNELYDELNQQLKILNEKADKALKKTSKSEILISQETNNPGLDQIY